MTLSNTLRRPLVVMTTIAILLPVERGLATFFFDFFAGSATTGFGQPPSRGVGGTGMFFVYASGYLPALLTLLPVLLVPRFGVATLAYMPTVAIGIPVGYYFEWITERTWVAWWSGIGWTAAFLLSAFSVDATYALLSGRVTERARAVLSGVVFGLVTYVTTVVALALVYRDPLPRDAGSFVGLTYFGLPWLSRSAESFRSTRSRCSGSLGSPSTTRPRDKDSASTSFGSSFDWRYRWPTITDASA